MTLAQIGLLLDIIGAIIIFFYGLPQKPQEQDGYVESGDLTENQKKINFKIKTLAYFGIGFIVIGFIFQFIYSIFPNPSQ